MIDWFSRHVLAWRLSNSMDVEFCIEALEEALSQGRPEIFNTDQGSQFTSHEFTSRLLEESIQISMDGQGRAIDNVMIERLWRSVKHEESYLKSYESGADCDAGLKAYFHDHTHERPHQSLGNQPPGMPSTPRPETDPPTISARLTGGPINGVHFRSQLSRDNDQESPNLTANRQGAETPRKG